MNYVCKYILRLLNFQYKVLLLGSKTGTEMCGSSNSVYCCKFNQFSGQGVYDVHSSNSWQEQNQPSFPLKLCSIILCSKDIWIKSLINSAETVQIGTNPTAFPPSLCKWNTCWWTPLLCAMFYLQHRGTPHGNLDLD